MRIEAAHHTVGAAVHHTSLEADLAGGRRNLVAAAVLRTMSSRLEGDMGCCSVEVGNAPAEDVSLLLGAQLDRRSLRAAAEVDNDRLEEDKGYSVEDILEAGDIVPEAEDIALEQVDIDLEWAGIGLE